MTQIGKYELKGRLGEGATSTVYLGYDTFAKRDVAIKIIKPEVLGNEQTGRLYRHLVSNEASLAGKLQHPHIVQIYDAAISGDDGYIVMEYVPGGTLEEFCTPDNLLPIDRLMEIVFKCTRALDYACRLGITHRDIKPANILLTRQGNTDGDIKISDFGAAMLADPAHTQTQVSGVGSPAYMSPQQVQDVPLNHQTDIWSLGVVMYQLLTGRLPFQASSNYGMIYQICNHEPPPPSMFRDGIPPNVDAVVSRAMQKTVEARYATWEEFSHELVQIFKVSQAAVTRKEFKDSEKFETLRALPFFRDFSDVEIWEVVRFSRWEEVSPDTVLMKDGETGDHFCFLIEGELRIVKHQKTLNMLMGGECFGEMAVITRNHVRGAAVIARTAAKVVCIGGNALRSASDTCQMHFYHAFLEVIASRLSQANIRLTAM